MHMEEDCATAIRWIDYGKLDWAGARKETVRAGRWALGAGRRRGQTCLARTDEAEG